MTGTRRSMMAAPVEDSPPDDDPPSPLESLWEGFGQPLLHQQCWCWGWDVRRPAGNLLLERGFVRSRPPASVAGSSAYLLRGGGYRVVLWGFGIHYSRRGVGSLFVGRYASLPLVSPADRPPADVWRPEDLPPMRRVDGTGSGAEILFPALLRWVAGYERWVRRVAGDDHREEAVEAWGDRRVVPGWRMAGAWSWLARDVRSCRSIVNGSPDSCSGQ